MDEPRADDAAVDDAAGTGAAVDEAAVTGAAVDEAAVDEAAVDEAAVDDAAVTGPGVDAPAVNDPRVIDRLLTEPGRWAVVGLSTNRARAAYGVAAYLQDLGHEIVPVHPRAETVHGEQGCARLADVPGPVDVVDVFVNSRRAGAVVDQAIEIGARAVWLQLGVTDKAAEQRALDAGLLVVVDMCPAIEGRRRGLPRP